MTTTGEIKARINSISETKKVTDAMYMISSVKMRKAKADMLKTRPYFTALKEEIGEIIKNMPETKNKYLKNADENKELLRRGLLLVTSDKGLAGGYNQNAIKLALRFIRENPDTTVFIVGEYGRKYFAHRNLPFVQEFVYSAAIASMWQARSVCMDLLEYYDNGKIDDLNIISTGDSVNGSDCALNCLLPLEKSSFACEETTDGIAEPKEFYPNAETVLDCVVPSYLFGYIYSSLVDSYFDEQEARMAAMNVAGKNAEDMLKQLNKEFNRVRQAAITNEMVEIASGAKALKKKAQKKKCEDDKNEKSNR